MTTSSDPVLEMDPTSSTILDEALAQKLDKAVEKTIPLVECFGPTVQGEGTVIGQQTYFLRFGLCDYKCAMCDSLHAVLPALVKKNAKWLTQADIFQELMAITPQHSTNWVTFSGGNPAIHDLTYLVGLCKLNDWKINVETQGTRYQGWLNKVDSLTISPKGPGMGETHDQSVFEGFMNKVFDNGLYPGAFIAESGDGIWFGPNLCIKIVVFDQRDLEFAKSIFTYLSNHPLFRNRDTSNHFYLSLGNPNPPNADTRNNSDFSIPELFKTYRVLYEDIQRDPVLCKVRFLPQLHTLIWGNGDGH